MWTIKQIFDGDYGCDELQAGHKTKVSVTLETQAGEVRYVTVEYECLTEYGLEKGAVWPIEK